MKESILVYAFSRTPWIGGVYYKKNIVNMMLNNEKIIDAYNVVILTNRKYKEVFQCFENKASVVYCSDKTGFLSAALQGFICLLKYKIKYVFPLKPYKIIRLLRIIPVSWIADFQHKYYPIYFEEKEIKKRDKDFKYIAKNNNPLILSSNDSLNDFRKFYSSVRSNIYVVHFTSYIDDDLNQMSDEKERNVLGKYNLSNKRYAIVCNQFWKHKNHIVVFKAIEMIANLHPDTDFEFVFTGELQDRRNPEYYREIKELTEKQEINDKVHILGFVSRAEQLCLIKKSSFLIQPSLFEGWGTVVEDAKVLNKRVLLSDIPVHREQRNENCILFNPSNPEELLKLIIKEFNTKYAEAKCADQTKEYAVALEEVFACEE